MTLQDERIQQIKNKICRAQKLANRPLDSVTLLAVSKGQPIEKISCAYQAGLTQFGENYWQEAEKKMEQLRHLSICWHFIGAIQSNKAKAIALHFDWVHTVSRFKIAKILSDERPHHLPPVNVCLQINFDDNKAAGIPAEAVEKILADILPLPGLNIRGLMMIPPKLKDEKTQYEHFLALADLLNSLNTSLNLNMDTLSMGMSQDYQPAIRAGSTIVRIGSALFGERT